MDLYGQKSRSTAQKVLIVLAEMALIAASYFVLFGDLLEGIRSFGSEPSTTRNATLFAFNLVVFARFLWTLFSFMERTIPWEEVASVPLAFALYFVGFPLLARPAHVGFGAPEVAGIALFSVGSFVNTFSEHQRKRWKARPENRGKLYTRGLFSLSMHVNYFGDLVWVAGYACVTHNLFAASVPVLLFSFFYFYNVPKLDAYLRTRYGDQLSAYERRTKRLIPFVL